MPMLVGPCSAEGKDQKALVNVRIELEKEQVAVLLRLIDTRLATLRFLNVTQESLNEATTLTKIKMDIEQKIITTCNRNDRSPSR